MDTKEEPLIKQSNTFENLNEVAASLASSLNEGIIDSMVSD